MFAPQLIDELMDALGAGTAPQWAEALCRDGTGASTDLFFSDQIPDINRAKAICAACPVAQPCLQGALDRREPLGVWGGHLFANGVVLAQKRQRGRPPKIRPLDDGMGLTA